MIISDQVGLEMMATMHSLWTIVLSQAIITANKAHSIEPNDALQTESNFLGQTKTRTIKKSKNS